MLVVTHEMGFAKDVRRPAIFIDNGVIVEEGAPRDLLSNPSKIDPGFSAACHASNVKSARLPAPSNWRKASLQGSRPAVLADLIRRNTS